MSSEKIVTKLTFEAVFLFHLLGLMFRNLSDKEKEVLEKILSKKVLLKDETK